VQITLGAGLFFHAFQGKTYWILVLLGAMWLLWITVFISNNFLVGCGTVDVRYRDARVWVNRPDLSSRVILHVLINWSALTLTIVVAWTMQGSLLSEHLAWLSMSASISVWIAFNVRHRRMNRVRNLTISTVFAVALIVACFFLIDAPLFA